MPEFLSVVEVADNLPELGRVGMVVYRVQDHFPYVGGVVQDFGFDFTCKLPNPLQGLEGGEGRSKSVPVPHQSPDLRREGGAVVANMASWYVELARS